MNDRDRWNSTQKKALEKLRGFVTARQLAREVGVSRVNAYRIIRAIAAEHTLHTKRVRQNDTGPLAVAYCLFKRARPA